MQESEPPRDHRRAALFLPTNHNEGRRQSYIIGPGPENMGKAPSSISLSRGKDMLTSDQKKAFKEVFDLFDSNGGGTIDADELEEALAMADIHLTKAEIDDVLTSMDKDGNGEIDFEEFLQLMTNTEKFLESVTCDKIVDRQQREILLFDALTQFMKKSALHSINEIVGYYHNKYKKVQQPHVIGHYADGARLIGLSEQQIRRHLDRLRQSSANNKSPYAVPPYSPCQLVKRKKEKNPITNLEPICENMLGNKACDKGKSNIKISDNIKLLVPGGGCGKIKLKIVHVHEDKEKTVNSEPSNIETQKPQCPLIQQPTAEVLSKQENKKYHGWIAQRTRTSKVPLPLLSVEQLIKEQMNREKNIREETKKKDSLTFNHVETLRKKVQSLAKVYHMRVNAKRKEEAIEHWDNLIVDQIPSENLRFIYTRSFKAYADYKTTPISSLCSTSSFA